MAKNKKKEVTIKGIIIMILLAGLVVWYVKSLNHRSEVRRTIGQKEEIEALVDYDMVGAYPKTPRDVAKLHNRYFKAFYGQKLKEEELEVMNDKSRRLYCNELIVANPDTESLDKLKQDIAAVKEQGYTYKMCELPEASQVQYFKKDGKEMASLEVCITVSTGKNMGYFYRQYAMVKENGLWKIYGWTESQTPAGAGTSQ